MCVFNDFSLMKYTGCCLTSVLASGHSTMITVLTTASVVTTYSSSTSYSFGGTSVGRALDESVVA
jgi:hypothetical protein